MEELSNLVASYIASNEKLNAIVQYTLTDPEAKILINRIRVLRMIINLIDNAYSACGNRDDARIDVIMDRPEELPGSVRIRILDNGDGISPEQVASVWHEGYSTGNSSGLGLAFVKKVVENHSGTIEIDSKVNEFTCVTIILTEASGYDD